MREEAIAAPVRADRAKITKRSPILIVALCIAGAASLTGCGASSNSGLQSELGQNELEAITGTSDLDGNAPNAASITQASLAGNSNASEAAPNAALARQATEAFTAAATPGSTAYKIGPQDVLDITVFRVPELSRSVQVADSGLVNLPLLGEVQAAGQTTPEFERELTERLGAEYLQSPQVAVTVKEYNSQRVTIEGAVKKPGIYPIQGKTSLLQLTAMAGGLDDNADHSGLVIIRQSNGKRWAKKFNIDEIRDGQTTDPALEKGDIVVVSHSSMKAAWQTFVKGLGVAGSLSSLVLF